MSSSAFPVYPELACASMLRRASPNSRQIKTIQIALKITPIESHSYNLPEVWVDDHRLAFSCTRISPAAPLATLSFSNFCKSARPQLVCSQTFTKTPGVCPNYSQSGNAVPCLSQPNPPSSGSLHCRSVTGHWSRVTGFTYHLPGCSPVRSTDSKGDS